MRPFAALRITTLPFCHSEGFSSKNLMRPFAALRVTRPRPFAALRITTLPFCHSEGFSSKNLMRPFAALRVTRPRPFAALRVTKLRSFALLRMTIPSFQVTNYILYITCENSSIVVTPDNTNSLQLSFNVFIPAPSARAAISSLLFSF